MTKWSHWYSTVWNTIRYPVLTVFIIYSIFIFQFLSLLSGLFSIVILITELTTIISHYIHKNLSIFGISITSLHNSMLRTLAAAVPLLYLLLSLLLFIVISLYAISDHSSYSRFLLLRVIISIIIILMSMLYHSMLIIFVVYNSHYVIISLLYFKQGHS